MKRVAAAIGILRDSADRVFMQQRPANSRYYGGYWEFPGGKIEAGETPCAALVRELKEEIGIVAAHPAAWVRRDYQYEHAFVTLHFFRVIGWHGTVSSCEGQRGEWRAVADMPQPLLPANECLWKWLALPARCVVSAAEIIGVEATLAQLTAVAQTAPLLQLRDKNLAAKDRARLAHAMAAALDSANSGGLLVVNDDDALAREVGAGLHLSSGRLMRESRRPPFEWVGASCHTAAELTQAQTLGLDYAVFSPINKTLTHVAAAPVGWDGFEQFAATSAIPLYALGGMTEAALPTAIARGGQGIAMMRAAWQSPV